MAKACIEVGRESEMLTLISEALFETRKSSVEFKKFQKCTPFSNVMAFFSSTTARVVFLKHAFSPLFCYWVTRGAAKE